MNKSEPYSVIIPAFNAADFISEAIASVLEQTVPPDEIVVVDDGSTDKTAHVASETDSSVQVLRQENAGPGAATSLGMRHCRAPILAFLDADDIWHADKMQQQLAYLASNSCCSGVFGRIKQFGEGAKGPVRDCWGRTTMVIRRQVFMELGDIEDPPGRRGEMVDWIARARAAGFEFVMLPATIAMRRIRPGSLSYGRDPQRDIGYMHAARRALERHRRGYNS